MLRRYASALNSQQRASEARIHILTEMALEEEASLRAAAVQAVRELVATRQFSLLFRHGPPRDYFHPRMLKMLGHADAEVRAAGASLMPAHGVPEAVEVLVHGVGDEDARVREACIAALQQGDLALGGLRAHLASSRAEVREAALLLLFRRADTREQNERIPFFRESSTFQDELAALLRDAVPSVRHLAAVLLPEGPEEVIREVALDAARSAGDARVQSRAAARVARSGQRMPELFQVIRERLERERGGETLLAVLPQLQQLARADVDVMDVLLSALRSIRGEPGASMVRGENPLDEALASVLRAYPRPERFIPRLSAELEDVELPEQVRVDVIHALTSYRVESAPPDAVVEVLLRELGGVSHEGIAHAAMALGALDARKQALTPVLLRMLDDPSLPAFARGAVAVVLGAFGERAAIPHLTALLELDVSLFPTRQAPCFEPRSCRVSWTDTPFLRDRAEKVLWQLGQP